jgi:hypothetical protein
VVYFKSGLDLQEHQAELYLKDKPYLVGERGAELFIPNSTGQVAQSARGMGSGANNS